MSKIIFSISLAGKAEKPQAIRETTGNQRKPHAIRGILEAEQLKPTFKI